MGSGGKRRLQEASMAKAILGATLADARGAINNEIFERRRGAMVVRGRPTCGWKPTPAQAESNAQFRQVTGAWNSLTYAQVQAWKDYAKSLTRHDPMTAQPYHPMAQNVFIGLARKFVQINPLGAIPL